MLVAQKRLIPLVHCRRGCEESCSNEHDVAHTHIHITMLGVSIKQLRFSRSGILALRGLTFKTYQYAVGKVAVYMSIACFVRPAFASVLSLTQRGQEVTEWLFISLILFFSVPDP